MSAIFGPAPATDCTRCGQKARGGTECAMCRKLGDRSLLWFIREMGLAETDARRTELRTRFAAAKGRSH